MVYNNFQPKYSSRLIWICWIERCAKANIFFPLAKVMNKILIKFTEVIAFKSQKNCFLFRFSFTRFLNIIFFKKKKTRILVTMFLLNEKKYIASKRKQWKWELQNRGEFYIRVMISIVFIQLIIAFIC